MKGRIIIDVEFHENAGGVEFIQALDDFMSQEAREWRYEIELDEGKVWEDEHTRQEYSTDSTSDSGSTPQADH